MARKQFKFESNYEKMSAKIQDVPHRVFNVIGQNLARESRQNISRQFNVRRGILRKSVGYWARRREKDLQIGFKMSIPGIVGKMMSGAEQDPFKPIVVKNKDLIQQLIAEAINEIGKR